MMQTQPMNSSDVPEGPADAQDASGTPVDDIISSVDSFIADPKSATPEALQQLKSDLMDLKTVIDGGDQSAPPAPPSGPPSAPGGMADMIAKMHGGGQ